MTRPVPYLSQLENGKIEPKIGLLRSLSDALDVSVADLVDPEPPNQRAELEVALERAQSDPRYKEFDLPYLKPSAKLPDEVLQHLIALWGAVPSGDGGRSLRTEDKARVANVELRQEMRERNNYFSAVSYTHLTLPTTPYV